MKAPRDGTDHGIGLLRDQHVQREGEILCRDVEVHVDHAAHGARADDMPARRGMQQRREPGVRERAGYLPSLEGAVSIPCKKTASKCKKRHAGDRWNRPGCAAGPINADRSIRRWKRPAYIEVRGKPGGRTAFDQAVRLTRLAGYVAIC